MVRYGVEPKRASVLHLGSRVVVAKAEGKGGERSWLVEWKCGNDCCVSG